jgi:thiopurine S-methyltransferase
MDHEFWHQRWEQNQIGFHQQAINEYLSNHWAELGLAEGAPVFVPLCGKSLDLLWLLEQGHAVLGVELSEKAVADFFQENALEYQRHPHGPFVAFHTEDLRLLAGDFFALQEQDLDGICAVYDRASLIALPPEMRRDYARKMQALLPSGAHILLITMQYQEGAMEGPPFSVSDAEVQALYGEGFEIQCKGQWPGEGPRGIAVTETVYSLSRR